MNPYPGTREFDAGEQECFFGRRQETEILVAQVLARRASLLFAPSGAGKTSLIRAGLVPELTRVEEIGRGRRRRTVQKMRVLPVAGVGGRIPPRLNGLLDNAFVFSALHSIFPDAEPEDFVGQRLTSGIGPLVGETGSKTEPVLLIIDQLEELFTQNTEHWRERQMFFEQIAEALVEHRGLRLLLSMREDFIAELTSFAGLLPGALRHRFRLERLRPRPALEAVRRPAELAGRRFAETVAEELVENLRRAQGGRPRQDGEVSTEPVLSEFVEPVHLQIVCRQLWENLDEGKTLIESGDLQRFGDVEQALRAFYDEGLRRVLERSSVPEHRLRSWFEDTALITPARTRGLVYRDLETTEGLPNAVVDELIETYLIRSVRRGSDTWFELAHDRLVEPILAANREWRALHLKPLTAAAEAWAKAGRDPRKLYSGSLLTQAQHDVWADPEAYWALEKEFLDVAAQREKKRRARLGLAVLFGLVFLALAAWAVSSYRSERSAQAAKKSTAIAVSSSDEIDREPELALLLALEAIERWPTQEAMLQRRQERLPSLLKYALRRALLEPQLLREWPTSEVSDDLASPQISPYGCSLEEVRRSLGVRSASLSPDGESVAVGDHSGGVRTARAADDCVAVLWQRPTLDFGAHRKAVNSVVFSADGDLLLTASADQTAAIWVARSGRLLARLRGHGDRVLSATWDSEGDSVLTSTPKVTREWRVTLPRVLRRGGARVERLGFSRDGRRLVTLSNSRVSVWEDGVELDGVPLGRGHLVNDGAFSPDGRWLATADNRHVVLVKNVVDASAHQLIGHAAEVTALVFSSDGQRLLSSGADDTARLWDWRSKKEERSHRHWAGTEASLSPSADRIVTSAGHAAEIWQPGDPRPVLLRHSKEVEGTAFDATGARVVTACRDGAVRLWSTSGELLAERFLSSEPIYDAAFSPDGRSVVAWSREGPLFLWWPEDGNTVFEFGNHLGALGAASFSSDGRWVLTLGDDRGGVWDAATGSRVIELLVNPSETSVRSAVTAMAWSADGRQLAVAWASGRIEILACEVCKPFPELLELARERLRPERPLTGDERKRSSSQN